MITNRDRILAAIKSRGWFPMGVYQQAAEALKAENKIKLGERYSATGNVKLVWVAA